MQPVRLLLIALSLLFAAQTSFACNWVRLGQFGETLECRSNWKNFFQAEREDLNQILKYAVYYAYGDAERITNTYWQVPANVSIEDGRQFLKKRFEAEAVLNDMNAQLRQWDALDGDTAFLDASPAAVMAGVTIPISGEMKIPGLGKLYQSLSVNPGGSAFVGWIILPQKIHYRMTNDGKIETVNEVTFDARFVFIPSLDLQPGLNGKTKKVFVAPTIGFVFGKNIMDTHQLLNSGWSASVPGTSVRAVKTAVAGYSTVASYLLPEWLIKPVEKSVDTIKIGLSTNAQNSNTEYDNNDIINFNENLFVWLRFGNNKNRINQTTNATQLSLPGLITSAITGRVRASWFWTLSPENDGQSSAFSNGMDDGGWGLVSKSLISTAKDIISAQPDRTSREILEDKIAQAEGLLKKDDLSAGERAKIEAELKVLKEKLENAPKKEELDKEIKENSKVSEESATDQQ